MQLFILIILLLVFLCLLSKQCKQGEHFYDWQTLGVNPTQNGNYEYGGPIGIQGGGCKTPRYQHDHSMFINTDNVGGGSCIYNKLDPSFDGVLPDWQWTLQKYGNTMYKSPPLDSVTHKVPAGCEECNSCK